MKRLLVVGDGAVGVAVAALLPGALVLPSQPPSVRIAHDTFPYGAGPRYVFPSDGADALLRAAGFPNASRRRLAFAYRTGSDYTLPGDASSATRGEYLAKLYRGTEPPRTSLNSTGGRGAGLDVYDIDYDDLASALRRRVVAESRLLPYEPIPPSPDPDAPLDLAVAGRFDFVVYTCPPSSVWRGFEGVAHDKVFLPVAPGPAADPAGGGFEYVYRPGSDVPWHRESIARGRDGTPAVVLEWTLPEAAPVTTYEREALDLDLVPLAPPRAFRGLQIVRPGTPVPWGRTWRPLGRIAEWDGAVLLSDVADALLSLREG